MLETLFKLKENGTTIRTEIVAGLTTFLTMAYIIFVNPDILSAAGMDKSAVFTATCIAAAIGPSIVSTRSAAFHAGVARTIALASNGAPSRG